MPREKSKSVVDIIADVVQTMCDEHCKFPQQYFNKFSNEEEAEEHLYSEKCEKCILNKLM